ncbi:MAG: hypothetical protein AVDCRST_MAG77-124 [uncultured Chloroflexi bacterium]|uniref:Uncharacterized protein n=1 Tax=uncultured Chloroflexota bacterium TaxID=166587 RepID=A0A6J4H948_9CHLR|nr:MAG: hypothetical protein AVDCRST_MAG77-124 [uncultured Chloroflexota bacterium]
MTFEYVRRLRALPASVALAVTVALVPVFSAAPVWAAPDTGAVAEAPAVPALAVSEGELLQVAGDDKIHLVQEGRRRWIADTTSLRTLSPDFARLRKVSFEELDSVPAGKPYRQLPLIRDAVSGRVYLLTRETGQRMPRKHWINDLDSFTRLGFEWNDVAAVAPAPPDRFPDAPALTYRPVVKTTQAWDREGEALSVVPAWRLQAEDERLYLALALSNTYNQEWREQVAPKLAAQGTWIEWGDLPEGVGGKYATGLNRVTLNRMLQPETTGVIATVLSHEVLHAVSEHGTGAVCIAEEVEAFGVGARTWSGLPAKWKSTTAWGRSLDQLVRVWRAGTLERYVANEPAYQEQCNR